MFYFFVYRGLGGLLAAIAPAVIGLILHWIIVTLILQHSFDVMSHFWSLGLSLFLGGLITAVVLQKQRDASAQQLPTPIPTVDVEDALDDEVEDPTSKQAPSTMAPFSVEAQPVAITTSNSIIPSTIDGLWNMASQAQGTDHLCYVAPNQIAAVYMAIGALLLAAELLDLILTPFGGLLNVVAWLVLLIIVGLMLGACYFACSDAPVSGAMVPPPSHPMPVEEPIDQTALDLEKNNIRKENDDQGGTVSPSSN